MQISGFKHIPAPHVSYKVGVRYYKVSSSADTLESRVCLSRFEGGFLLCEIVGRRFEGQAGSKKAVLNPPITVRPELGFAACPGYPRRHTQTRTPHHRVGKHELWSVLLSCWEGGVAEETGRQQRGRKGSGPEAWP